MQIDRAKIRKHLLSQLWDGEWALYHLLWGFRIPEFSDVKETELLPVIKEETVRLARDGWISLLARKDGADGTLFAVDKDKVQRILSDSTNWSDQKTGQSYWIEFTPVGEESSKRELS